MIKKLNNIINNIFKNLEEKTLKIMKAGLRFSLLVAILSSIILITYLFFLHSALIFKIGLLIFELSIYFAVDFIVSGITVDSIKKHII